MKEGTIDLLILLTLFILLQIWWLIPIIKIKFTRNRNLDLQNEINKLERIFKK